jgi:hypothetical protein
MRLMEWKVKKPIFLNENKSLISFSQSFSPPERKTVWS